MAETLTAPAPAPAETPAPTISADRAASEAGDFSAFKEAHLAGKRGQPLPDVPVEKAPAPVQTSKRQERQNEAVRAAAEKAVTDAQATDRAEIARLKAELAGRAAPPPAPARAAPERQAAPATAPTTFEEAIRRPDLSAALMTEATFFETYPDAPYSAYARYAVQYDLGASKQADTRRAESASVQEAQKTQIQSFVTQVQAAAAADPTFATGLSDQVKHQLKPFGALRRDQGDVPGPINVIGEQVYASDVAPQMLTYFSTEAGAADLARLTTLPPSLATLPASLRDSARISWMIREYGKLEGRVAGEVPAGAADPAAPALDPTTALPPPPPTLTRAGGSSRESFESATVKKDVRRALQIALQERARRRSSHA